MKARTELKLLLVARWLFWLSYAMHAKMVMASQPAPHCQMSLFDARLSSDSEDAPQRTASNRVQVLECARVRYSRVVMIMLTILVLPALFSFRRLGAVAGTR